MAGTINDNGRALVAYFQLLACPAVSGRSEAGVRWLLGTPAGRWASLALYRGHPRGD